MQSRAFILDIISLLPTDFLYFIPKLSLLPALRFNRLFRIYRTLEFSDKVETQTNHPNVFRLVSLLIIILIIIHWNACFYFIISRWIGYSSDGWVYNMTTPTATTLTTQYLYCFFWSTLVLTNIGEVPPPETDVSGINIWIECFIQVFFSEEGGGAGKHNMRHKLREGATLPLDKTMFGGINNDVFRLKYFLLLLIF
jgi:hypothetical protein